MNVAEVTAKAKVLLEALPYIQDFRGSTFVVKYGGSFMDDPDPVARNRVAADIAFLAAVGINVVVVHGGGKAITKAMAESGLKARPVPRRPVEGSTARNSCEEAWKSLVTPSMVMAASL